MNVFISWSGERSRCVAEALRTWLKQVINALDPWISVADIDKGARWRDHVASRLKASDIGIICLTPGNLRSEWLLFEAGALSKAIDTAYVCPLLLDLEPSDVGGPLAQFQATRARKDEIRKLIDTINSALGGNARSTNELDEAFEVWWPRLENQLKSLPSESGALQPQRPERELLEEVLAIVREQSRVSAQVSAPSPATIFSTPEDVEMERRALSFQTSLRKDLESLPGIYRARVDVFSDRYCVSIDPAPFLNRIPKTFEFAWDDEPLNSTGKRAVDGVAAYLADLESARVDHQRSYGNEDTPHVARFRSALIDELRLRKLDFTADAVQHCLISVLESDRIVLSGSRTQLMCLKDPSLSTVVVKVYRLLFDRIPKLELQDSRTATSVGLV